MNNELAILFNDYDVPIEEKDEKDEIWFRVDDLKKVLFSESNDPGDSMNKIVNIIIKDFEKKSEAEGKNTVGVPYEPEIKGLSPREKKFKEKHISGSKYVSYINDNMLYEILFRTNSPIATKLKVRAVAIQSIFNYVKNTYPHLRKNGKSPKDIEEMLLEAFDDVFGESMARNLTWWNENYSDSYVKAVEQ